MNPELLGRLQPFREEALKPGIPPEDVERWIATARPSGTLVTSGDGPVVGRFGGPLMLPPEAPDPWTPLLATLDCAALPEEVTGLPLPPDGRLLLFGFPDMEMTWYSGSVGEVVYMPDGTPAEERKTRYAYLYGEEGDDVDEHDPAGAGSGNSPGEDGRHARRPRSNQWSRTGHGLGQGLLSRQLGPIQTTRPAQHSAAQHQDLQPTRSP